MSLSDPRPAREQFGERRLIDPGGRWNGPMTVKVPNEARRPRSPTMRDARNQAFRKASLALPQSAETTPQCDRPRAPGPLRRHPARTPANPWTGGTHSGRGEVICPPESRNAFGDEHPACVNCRRAPGTARANPSSPPVPAPARLPVPSSRPRPDRYREQPKADERRVRRQGRRSPAAYGKRTAVERRTGVVPSGGSRFLSGRHGRKPPGGHETPKRSDAPFRKTLRG